MEKGKYNIIILKEKKRFTKTKKQKPQNKTKETIFENE